MKTPQQLSQEIIDIIKATGNYFVGNTSGMNNDGTVNVYHPKGYSISAIAANHISSGEVVVFKVNDQWYAFGEQRAIVKQDILIQRKSRQNIQLVYSVITLIAADLVNETKPNNADSEFWLTGGKFSLKRIPTLDYPLNHKLDQDYRDGFILNLGNKKYLASTRTYDQQPDFSLLWKYRTVKNDVLVGNEITIDGNVIGRNFEYLGNGIWQSTVSTGIGIIIDAYNTTIAKNQTPIIVSYEVLPENKHFSIVDGNLIEYAVNLTVETSVWTNPVGLAIDRGLSNKTITFSNYLPTGNVSFGYSAVRSGTIQQKVYTENISGEVLSIVWDKQYITHQFNATKITTFNQTYPDYPPDSFLFNNYTYTEKINKTQSIKLKNYDNTNTLELNANGKFLVVDMKPKAPFTLNSTTFTIEIREKSFQSIGITQVYDYKSVTSANLQTYVGENVITSYAFDNKPYLIKGTILTINERTITNPFNGTTKKEVDIIVGNLSKKKLEKTKYKTKQQDFYVNKDANWGLPFVYKMILDNGCFWNYYLSQRTIFAGNVPDYALYQYSAWLDSSWAITNNIFNIGQLLNQNIQLISDQTIEFIHTNPISRNFLKYNSFNQYNPSHSLLLTDNLVKDTIYRVLDDWTLQFLWYGDYENIVFIFTLPIAEWKIKSNGDVKFDKVIYVDYAMKFPYYTGENKAFQARTITPLGFSYYPDIS